MVTSKVHSLWRLRTLAWSGLGLLLAWQVVAQSLAAYLAGSAPGAALWLHPQQPAALVNFADQAFNAHAVSRDTVPENPEDDGTLQPAEHASETMAQSSTNSSNSGENLKHAFSAFEAIGRNQSIARPIAPENAPQVHRWLEAALLNQPLNARALRMLGQLAEADGDDASAFKFMEAAARLSLHDQVAALWLMKKSAQTGDDNATIYYADVVLRTTPELGSSVVPVLAGIAEEKSANGILTAILASNPPWRGQFFSALPNYLRDARAPLQLLVALRTSDAPPSADEINNYVNFLVARKFYDLAYYTWLQFLPPEELRNAALLYNGNFDVKPSGSAFDWQIASGAGVTVDIVPRSDKEGAHALMVDFQFGRVDYQSVRELIMLAPGTYELKGSYKGQLTGPRGLKWRAACVDGTNAQLGESPTIIGIANDWNSLSFSFTVPATGCRAQYVRLDLDARMASEQFISGSMLFGELEIARIANPS